MISSSVLILLYQNKGSGWETIAQRNFVYRSSTLGPSSIIQVIDVIKARGCSSSMSISAIRFLSGII
ncbi:hypothetical protein DPMN_032183 [Dreissena polymorpha]|uniref:Uncharacterized protein n=1 Tax=Dreissena polymorpha TaxID=45954 RepID=A0A9D4RJT2_DREPO|nr:hypothetical protein DPMN_032183 [Dreissena polymorpha]